MPIVIPLAEAVNADLPLVLGALISASAFGSHTCFYGDSTANDAAFRLVHYYNNLRGKPCTRNGSYRGWGCIMAPST